MSSPAAVLYAPKLPVTYFTDLSSFTFGCSPDQWNSRLETAKMGGTNNYVPASRGCKEAAGLTGDPKKHSVSLGVSAPRWLSASWRMRCSQLSHADGWFVLFLGLEDGCAYTLFAQGCAASRGHSPFRILVITRLDCYWVGSSDEGFSVLNPHRSFNFLQKSLASNQGGI